MLTETGKRVAERVLRLRKAKKLTQGGLAGKANLSISYVSMIERARREPSFAALESLAKALETTVARMVS